MTWEFRVPASVQGGPELDVAMTKLKEAVERATGKCLPSDIRVVRRDPPHNNDHEADGA